MRIGKTILDTDNMTAEELTMYINALSRIRTRRARQETLTQRMNDLILQAKADGFTFIDKDFGFVREVDDFTMLDEKA